MYYENKVSFINVFSKSVVVICLRSSIESWVITWVNHQRTCATRCLCASVKLSGICSWNPIAGSCWFVGPVPRRLLTAYFWGPVLREEVFLSRNTRRLSSKSTPPTLFSADATSRAESAPGITLLLFSGRRAQLLNLTGELAGRLRPVTSATRDSRPRRAAGDGLPLGVTSRGGALRPAAPPRPLDSFVCTIDCHGFSTCHGHIVSHAVVSGPINRRVSYPVGLF